jgi:hypothetical protein
MNAMFGHSLGASDAAQWLFVAVGMASDCAALVLPSSAAAAWAAARRGVSRPALVTFAFAVTAGIGFASHNGNPRPYVWTKTAAGRAKQALKSQH